MGAKVENFDRKKIRENSTGSVQIAKNGQNRPNWPEKKVVAAPEHQIRCVCCIEIKFYRHQFRHDQFVRKVLLFQIISQLSHNRDFKNLTKNQKVTFLELDFTHEGVELRLQFFGHYGLQIA